MIHCAAALLVGAVAWFTVTLMLRVAPVALALALASALLPAALLAPLATRLRRLGLPAALAALLSIVVLLGFPTGVGLLLDSRVSGLVTDLAAAVTAGLDDVRGG